MIAATVMIAASARAQGGVTPSELSDVEKAAVGAMLDSLGTKTGDELRTDIVHEIDTVKATGKSGEAVVVAVKAGAGLKLGLFQSVLVDLCVQGGGKGYCRLAALQAPAQENDEIRTAATDAGPGGAGGYAGFGGGPQANGGHNSGWLGSSSPTIVGGDQVFHFSVNTASSGYSGTNVVYLMRTISAPVAVPAPQAGAGLPAMGVLLWFLRSWWLSKRGKIARRHAFGPGLTTSN